MQKKTWLNKVINQKQKLCFVFKKTNSVYCRLSSLSVLRWSCLWKLTVLLHNTTYYYGCIMTKHDYFCMKYVHNIGIFILTKTFFIVRSTHHCTSKQRKRRLDPAFIYYSLANEDLNLTGFNGLNFLPKRIHIACGSCKVFLCNR